MCDSIINIIEDYHQYAMIVNSAILKVTDFDSITITAEDVDLLVLLTALVSYHPIRTTFISRRVGEIMPSLFCIHQY